MMRLVTLANAWAEDWEGMCKTPTRKIKLFGVVYIQPYMLNSLVRDTTAVI